jgi:hypothetical protein
MMVKMGKSAEIMHDLWHGLHLFILIQDVFARSLASVYATKIVASQNHTSCEPRIIASNCFCVSYLKVVTVLA